MWGEKPEPEKITHSTPFTNAFNSSMVKKGCCFIGCRCELKGLIVICRIDVSSNMLGLCDINGLTININNIFCPLMFMLFLSVFIFVEAATWTMCVYYVFTWFLGSSFQTHKLTCFLASLDHFDWNKMPMQEEEKTDREQYSSVPSSGKHKKKKNTEKH